MTSQSPNKLYRPYLSLPEISHLCSILAPNLSSLEAKTAYGKLFRLKLEAEMGLRSSAHTLQPSLEQKLGFSQGQETQTMSGKEAWEILNIPSKAGTLSPMQIQLGKTYGWKEGLMSSVEASLFEQEMGL